MATGAWAMWKREDPQVALVRDMMSNMENIPENQRREHFGKVRDEMHHTADIGDDTPKVIIMLPANGREVNMPAEPK